MDTMLIVVGALFASALIISAFIARMARRARLELAEIGRTFIQSNITDQEKALVNAMLDDAFSPSLMIKAVLFMPVMVFRSIAKPESIRRARTCDTPVNRLVRRENGEKFFELHQKSAMAANPIFAALFIAEFAIAVVVLIVFGVSFLLAFVLQKAFLVDMKDGASHTNGRLAH